MGVAVDLKRHSAEPEVRLTGYADLAAGQISDPVPVPVGGLAVAVYPAAGATVKVWRSTSRWSLVTDDLTNLRLTKTNLEGDQVAAGMKSRWALWATGAVTGAGLCFAEGPVESEGDTAVLAESTGGAARFEVSQ
jgi:hypothetical protein